MLRSHISGKWIEDNLLPQRSSIMNEWADMSGYAPGGQQHPIFGFFVAVFLFLSVSGLK